MLRTLVKPPTVQHSATLIFLHGSCYTGEKQNKYLRLLLGEELEFEQIKIIYPTAQERPYTLKNGEVKTVWFDRIQLNPFVAECLESVDNSCVQIMKLIENEVNSGIPESKIVVGGFSMGGALALHIAYRFSKNLAGVFTLSSFLSFDSAVFTHLEKSRDNRRLPPLLMCHGIKDELVLKDWGKNTFAHLQTFNLNGIFKEFCLDHSMSEKEMYSVKNWIIERLNLKQI